MKKFLSVATALVLVVCAVLSFSACSDDRLPRGKYVSASNSDVSIVVSGKKLDMTSEFSDGSVTIHFTHEIIKGSSSKSISMTYLGVSYEGDSKVEYMESLEWIESMFAKDEPTVVDLVMGKDYFTLFNITFYKR